MRRTYVERLERLQNAGVQLRRHRSLRRRQPPHQELLDAHDHDSAPPRKKRTPTRFVKVQDNGSMPLELAVASVRQALLCAQGRTGRGQFGAARLSGCGALAPPSLAHRLTPSAALATAPSARRERVARPLQSGIGCAVLRGGVQACTLPRFLAERCRFCTAYTQPHASRARLQNPRACLHPTVARARMLHGAAADRGSTQLGRQISSFQLSW